MAVFLGDQLDYILFFYGFGFLLLGLVCIGISRTMETKGSSITLGLFGLLHGTAEWLDLLALIAADGFAFKVIRLAIMTTSFMALMESARLRALELHWKAPGRWIHGPLLSLVVIAAFQGGLADGNTAARYAIGLTGSIGTGFLLIQYAMATSGGERRWALGAGVGFALYGIAAGAIVPAVWLPYTILSQNGFYLVTGIPIQLVRGLLALTITLSLWGIWSHKATRHVASPRYTQYWKRQSVWTLSTIATILLTGWLLTEYLGQVYNRTEHDAGSGEIDLMASLLDTEMVSVDGVAKVLAESLALQAFLASPNSDRAAADKALRAHAIAAGARLGYVIDRQGTVVASTDPQRIGGHEDELSSSLAAKTVHSFSYEAIDGERAYVVSYPVRNERGEVLGLVVLSKSLAAFEATVNRFDRPLLLVDPNGVTVLTNNSDMALRTLWPLKTETVATLSLRFKELNSQPILSEEPVDATWVAVNGERDFARRQDILETKWSLIMLIRPKGLGASRSLGIIITLLAAAAALAYIVGRERRVYDAVQSEKRLELEDLTRALDQRANTDSLTGAFNRLKFNQELATQIARSLRYGTALSLILFDVDHFKKVNDTFGHLAGDNVLIRLSDLTRRSIRSSDVHARWGGEEFVVLASDTTSSMAYQLAESLRVAIETCPFDDIGTMTCSFGVAQFEANDTAESLTARADGMLYRAKLNGRNRVEEAGRAMSESTP